MKEILIPKQTLWDEQNEKFIEIEEQTIILEHSLKAIRKWECKWKKSYLSTPQKTVEEALDYLKCMTVNKVDPMAYLALTEEDAIAIKDYMQDPMTATTINSINKDSKNEIITAEIVYYWMIAQNIPWQFENWHINQLMMLIQVCSIKNDPKPKKVNRRDLAASNRDLNAKRRAALHSKG